MSIDLFRLRPGDEGYREAVLGYFAGTYKSNWYFLANAARSNLMSAARITAEIIQGYQKATEGGQRPAEKWFVTTINYSLFLSGSLLGTVLVTSAAIEAFLRLAMRAFHEQALPSKRRAAGTSRFVLAKLKEFDSLSAVGRLREAYRGAGQRQCPESTMAEFKRLTIFRNECFHADPVLILAGGEEETTRHGTIAGVRSGKGSQYPLLWDSNFPLGLSHAVRAARLHDAIVSDLFALGSSFALNDRLHDDDRQNGLILHRLPGGFAVEVLRRIAKEWDERVLPTLAAVSDGDTSALLSELERYVNPPVVK